MPLFIIPSQSVFGRETIVLTSLKFEQCSGQFCFKCAQNIPFKRIKSNQN